MRVPPLVAAILWYSLLGAGLIVVGGYGVAVGTSVTMGGVATVLLFGGIAVSVLAALGSGSNSRVAPGAIEPGSSGMIESVPDGVRPRGISSAVKAFFLGLGCTGYSLLYLIVIV